MKKHTSKPTDWLHKRHSIILSVSLIILVSSIITLMVLFFLGYRFTINEDVRPDWEAFGTIFSFIAAVSAIAVAAGIPWLIAKKQNAIVLFEKREEVFNYISRFTHIWWAIGNGEDIDRDEFCVYIIRYRIGREKETVFYSEVKPLSEYYRLTADLQEIDLCYLVKIKHLFVIGDEYITILNEVISKTEEVYDDIMDFLFVKYNEDSHKRILKTLAKLDICLSNKKWSELLDCMDSQVTLSKFLQL